MAGRTPRENVVIAQRRQQVAARYLHGEYQSQIARDLGLDQSLISLDLKAIRAEWLRSSLRDFDALKSEQLAKIDACEAEAWASWEKSKQVREITVTEATEGARPGRKAVMRKEAQVGDPRFLERILKCVEQRCTLMGLNAPQKFAPTNPEGTQSWEGTSGLAALLQAAHQFFPHPRASSPSSSQVN